MWRHYGGKDAYPKGRVKGGGVWTCRDVGGGSLWWSGRCVSRLCDAQIFELSFRQRLPNSHHVKGRDSSVVHNASQEEASDIIT